MQNNIQDILSWKYKGQDISYSCGEEYETLNWEEENIIAKPTRQEVEQADIEYSVYLEATAYKALRAKEYPSVIDQLDLLYHVGYDGWKAVIKAVKDNYPKP